MQCTKVFILLATLGLTAGQIAAQSVEFPPGMDPSALMNMTPEQLEQMQNDLILNYGDSLGIDRETMENASPEEREEILHQRGEVMQQESAARAEEMFGMTLEEMETLTEAEKQELFLSRMNTLSPLSPVEVEPLGLLPAPPNGFADGSIPLPVGEDLDATLDIEGPAGKIMLLVVADMSRRTVVLNQERTPPFQEFLRLDDLSDQPRYLIIELIDPETHRVSQRYRPVAAGN